MHACTYLAYKNTYMYNLPVKYIYVLIKHIDIYICITYLAYRYTYMLLIKQININTCNSFRAKLGQKILSKCRV